MLNVKENTDIHTFAKHLEEHLGSGTHGPIRDFEDFAVKVLNLRV